MNRDLGRINSIILFIMEVSTYKHKFIAYSFFLIIIIRLCDNQEIPEPKPVYVENWTSCDEFLGNHTFNITSVIGIDWKIFYFWSYMVEESYHIKFSLPGKEVGRENTVLFIISFSLLFHKRFVNIMSYVIFFRLTSML